MSTKKMVFIGLLIAQAMVLNYVEGFIPIPLGIPGAKIGLANIVTVISLYTLAPKTTFFIVLGRTLLSTLLFGNVSVFLYSFSGALLSFMVMALIYKKLKDKVSIPMLSIIGAIFHNVGQVLMASLIIQNPRLIVVYLPILIIIAIPTGLFVGLASKTLLSYLQIDRFNF